MDFCKTKLNRLLVASIFQRKRSPKRVIREAKFFSGPGCAESIGSIMKISTGKNRNLEPINFSKEIYLCFNLPPLHVSKKSFIPEVVGELRKNKRFFRETAKGAASYLAKLKYKDASSSLGNFRTKGYS